MNGSIASPSMTIIGAAEKIVSTSMRIRSKRLSTCVVICLLSLDLLFKIRGLDQKFRECFGKEESLVKRAHKFDFASNCVKKRSNKLRVAFTNLVGFVKREIFCVAGSEKDWYRMETKGLKFSVTAFQKSNLSYIIRNEVQKRGRTKKTPHRIGVHIMFKGQ